MSTVKQDLDRQVEALADTHAATLFSVFARAQLRGADIGGERCADGSRVLPDVADHHVGVPVLLERIVSQLSAEGLDEHALGELDPARVTIARTADRSVLGCMNDLALTCQLAVEDAGGLARVDLRGLHRILQRHIYAARGYVPAIDLIADFAGRSKVP